MSNPFNPSKTPAPVVKLPTIESGRGEAKEKKLIEKNHTRLNPRTEEFDRYKVVSRKGSNLGKCTNRSTFR